MRDMNITFTDSVATASFDTIDGSIEINLLWWAGLSNDDKADLIVHQLESLVDWRVKNACDSRRAMNDAKSGLGTDISRFTS